MEGGESDVDPHSGRMQCAVERQRERKCVLVMMDSFDVNPYGVNLTVASLLTLPVCPVIIISELEKEEGDRWEGSGASSE